MRSQAALGSVSCSRATGWRTEATGSNSEGLVSVSEVLREGKCDQGK